MESEKTTEKYLADQVSEMGGFTRKWVSPGHAGVPDRICFFPYGFVMFVETKSEGKPLSPMQERELIRLGEFGFITAMVDTKTGVDELLKSVAESQLFLKKLADRGGLTFDMSELGED